MSWMFETQRESIVPRLRRMSFVFREGECLIFKKTDRQGAAKRRVCEVPAMTAPVKKPRYRYRICAECDRVFDLADEVAAQEWFYGHDCEAE